MHADRQTIIGRTGGDDGRWQVRDPWQTCPEDLLPVGLNSTVNVMGAFVHGAMVVGKGRGCGLWCNQHIEVLKKLMPVPSKTLALLVQLLPALMAYGPLPGVIGRL